MMVTKTTVHRLHRHNIAHHHMPVHHSNNYLNFAATEQTFVAVTFPALTFSSTLPSFNFWHGFLQRDLRSSSVEVLEAFS